MRSIVLLSFVLAGAPALADLPPTPPPQAKPADPAPSQDPIAGHTLSLEDALKGVKGAGTLTAKIEVEQGGKLLGTFTCELFDKQAPRTVANFVGLARGVRPWKDAKSGEWVKKPLYNGLTFHRVIPEFMIQGGDPDGTGVGGPGYEFADEFADELKMDKGGILAMANRGPGTNGSQFFITEKPTPWLTGKHTIFGACDPLELEIKIARLPTSARNLPATPVLIKKVTIARVAAKAGKK
jgi:peptidyl-prolyl cis-trans isomerase A (cyclophilin A)